MYANEVWNSISVYGPQPEIDRLKKLCAVRDASPFDDQPVVDFRALMPGAGLGQRYSTWNLKRQGPHEADSFRFGFDTPDRCPVEIFERLAAEFPSLAFYCTSMASMDEFKASGWFNGPSGSRELEYSDVPQGYWEGRSQGEESSEQHLRLVEGLKRAARQASL